jgi:HEAT repeat protein
MLNRRGCLLAVAVSGASLAYFLFFLSYGISVEDEGTLLSQFSRYADGQRLYVDFHSGYTPGVYWLHGALHHLFDHSILAGRVVLALVNTAAVALLAVLALELAGASAAVAAAALYVSSMPVYPAQFASFNTPYPAWYIVPLWAGGMLCLLRYSRAPSLWPLVGAALLCACSFAFKPNVGLFQLAVAMLVVLAVNPRRGKPESSRGRLQDVGWWWLTWCSVVAGLLAVFAGRAGPREFVILLLPVLAAALLVARQAASESTARSCSIVRDGAVLGLVFVALTAPWLIHYGSAMALDRFAERVLFIGSGFETLFYKPHPELLLKAGLMVVAAAALWVAPALCRRLGVDPSRVALAGAAGALVLLAALFFNSVMPEGFAAAVTRRWDDGAFALVLAVHWALLAAWAASIRYGRHGMGGLGPAEMTVLTLGSVGLYLQVYPRTDSLHLVMAAPVSMTAFVVLLSIAGARWQEGQSGAIRAAVTASWLLPLLFLAGVRVAPGLAAVFDTNGTVPKRPPSVELASDRAPVWINAGRSGYYDSLSALLGFIEENTDPGEEIFTFPNGDLVSALSGRHNATRHGYFFPRWPGHIAEAETVDLLLDDPPRLAILVDDVSAVFGRAPAYYFLLGDYLKKNYSFHARFGRFVVMAHRELGPVGTAAPWHAGGTLQALSGVERQAISRGMESDSPPRRVTTTRRIASYHAEDAFGPALDALSDNDQRVRNAAVWALASSRSPVVTGALVRAVTGGSLAPREEELALRVYRLGADRSSVGDVLELYEDDPGRFSVAAAGGLLSILDKELSASFLREIVGDGSEATPILTPDTARRLKAWRRATPSPGVDVFSAMVSADIVTGMQGRDGLSRAEFCDDGGDNPACLLALLAWARAGRADEILEEAFELLAVDDMLAPRVAVLAVRQSGPAGDTALARAIGQPGSSMMRESAAWMAAVCGGAQAESALAGLLGAGDARLRAAAAWGLGYRGAKARLAELELLLGDEDSDVREFARASVSRLRSGQDH